MSTSQPNILVIMTDQHNRAAMGCAGHPFARTPHLDQLARQGMRFTNTYCAAPLCVPSRMSFMTCRTPSHNGVWDNRHTLSSGCATWAHALGAAGYETSLIGRMHFVGADQRHGFERRPTGEFMARHPGAPIEGGPMWRKFGFDSCGQNRNAVETAGHGHTHYQWGDEHVTDVAVDYLHRQARSDRPFACVVGYMLPHCPFIALKELFDDYIDKVDVPDIEDDQPPSIARLRRNRNVLDLDPQRIRNARAAYFGLIEHVDAMIGRVVGAVDDAGLARDTLVVYCSDHGEMAGEHGCWWKSSYYEGSAGVPMIARLPGAIAEGVTCDAVCNLMDLGATFADAAGAAYDVAHDGRSLWPTLCGSHPADWRDVTFSEFVDSRFTPRAPSRMVRDGDWKLWKVHDADDLPPALFNLADDPQEVRDLGRDPAHAAVRDRLLAMLYDGWAPDVAAARSAAMDADYEAIARWGAATAPRHEDALAMPTPDYEDDVILL